MLILPFTQVSGSRKKDKKVKFSNRGPNCVELLLANEFIDCVLNFIFYLFITNTEPIGIYANMRSLIIIVNIRYLNRESMPHYPDEIEYSDKYMDDYYEYRHVILPREVYKKVPRGRLLAEN